MSATASEPRITASWRRVAARTAHVEPEAHHAGGATEDGLGDVEVAPLPATHHDRREVGPRIVRQRAPRGLREGARHHPPFTDDDAVRDDLADTALATSSGSVTTSSTSTGSAASRAMRRATPVPRCDLLARGRVADAVGDHEVDGVGHDDAQGGEGRA